MILRHTRRRRNGSSKKTGGYRIGRGSRIVGCKWRVVGVGACGCERVCECVFGIDERLSVCEGVWDRVCECVPGVGE